MYIHKHICIARIGHGLCSQSSAGIQFRLHDFAITCNHGVASGRRASGWQPASRHAGGRKGDMRAGQLLADEQAGWEYVPRVGWARLGGRSRKRNGLGAASPSRIPCEWLAGAGRDVWVGKSGGVLAGNNRYWTAGTEPVRLGWQASGGKGGGKAGTKTSVSRKMPPTPLVYNHMQFKTSPSAARVHHGTMFNHTI